ncbi:MAG: GntP family permease [Spirochaetaceae bacterium]
MVSGPIALVLLVVAVVLIIYGTAKLQVNAFVVLISVAFLYGLAILMPLSEIINHVTGGFGGTLGYIGIVIISGTIIGTILEKTGAAISITQSILNVVGEKRSPLAMSFAGFVVSVPVFCDSGYVILTPLNKALSVQAKKSMAMMAVALGTGLHATHALVPPTPGPVAAAAELNADLGAVIIFGLLAALVSMFAGYLYATKVASKYDLGTELEESYDDLKAKYGTLPGSFHSMLPLLVPILLIVLGSIAQLPGRPFGEGAFYEFSRFIGAPALALIIGVLVALTLVPKKSRVTARSEWIGQGVQNAALILAITGAGGAFGRILQNSPMVPFIEESMSGLQLGLFLPFLIAVALKIAQGSGTVSIITTAAIMAPLLDVFGLNPVLTVLAIGSGAVVVSHANDSYFWVVTQFAGMPASMGYKLWTVSTGIQGVASFIFVLILSLFM